LRPVCGPSSTRSRAATPRKTLRAELQAAEQRKKALVAELEALTGRKQPAASLDVERLRRELRRHVAEIRTLLGQDIPRTRQILRRLLVGRLDCEAFDEGTRVGYRFKAKGSYAPLLPAGLTTPEVVTPGGFCERWAPLFRSLARPRRRIEFAGRRRRRATDVRDGNPTPLPAIPPSSAS